MARWYSVCCYCCWDRFYYIEITLYCWYLNILFCFSPFSLSLLLFILFILRFLGYFFNFAVDVVVSFFSYSFVFWFLKYVCMYVNINSCILWGTRTFYCKTIFDFNIVFKDNINFIKQFLSVSVTVVVHAVSEFSFNYEFLCVYILLVKKTGQNCEETLF